MHASLGVRKSVAFGVKRKWCKLNFVGYLPSRLSTYLPSALPRITSTSPKLRANILPLYFPKPFPASPVASCATGSLARILPEHWGTRPVRCQASGSGVSDRVFCCP